jgi:hypothetical protein
VVSKTALTTVLVVTEIPDMHVAVLQDTRVQTVNIMITVTIRNVLDVDLVRMEITDTRVGVTLDMWGKTVRHGIIAIISTVLTTVHV